MMYVIFASKTRHDPEEEPEEEIKTEKKPKLIENF
jgi:hypothetical protein